MTTAARKHTYNVYEAKTQLSRLLVEVESGAEIVIARDGRPIARLVPVAPTQPRIPGAAKGEIWMSDDLLAPLPEDMLEGLGP